MVEDKKIDLELLNDVTGGASNKNGLYTFKAGEKIYINKNKTAYITISNSNFKTEFAPNDAVMVTLVNTTNGMSQATTMYAKNIYEKYIEFNK